MTSDSNDSDSNDSGQDWYKAIVAGWPKPITSMHWCEKYLDNVHKYP